MFLRGRSFPPDTNLSVGYFDGVRPERLDLTDTACMAARQAGVKLAVSSDSHHTSGFGLLEFGINQARRGWVQAADVVNTQPLEDLRARRRLA
jgi:histidinol phosphatase-like PHP family hydrolase